MASDRKFPAGLVALKKIVEGTSETTGQSFFESLVKNLADILNVYGVWITEYLETRDRLRALAFILDGEFVTEYEYQVRGTPCEPVLDNEGICHVPDRVIELFPEDPDLEPLGAVSYMGIALRDTNGKVLGHLAILDNKPMEEIPEAFAIFRIFASRAAAEMRRLNSDRIIHENREKLQRLLNGTWEMIIEFNESLRITQVNQAFMDTLRYSPAECDARAISDFFDSGSYRNLMKAIQYLQREESRVSAHWVPGPLFCLTSLQEKIPVEATLSSYSYHQNIYFACFVRNIQEQLDSENTIRKLSLEKTILREKIREHEFDDILGESPAIRNTLILVSQVSKTSSTVLIQGETGTGKELIAQAIHQSSERKNESFITLNCAALPEDLIESELFGHVKGAFTGATDSRDGRFLLAHKGTIFLDEIGELPVKLQPKLLRVLQEGTFESVGSSERKKVDVRVIAATNRDLKEEVDRGAFREDLYYRLNVFPIPVPPLRERGEDVILLARAFLAKFSRRHGLVTKVLNQSDQLALKNYSWPGNVRELQNIVERAVIISRDDEVDLTSLLAEQKPQMQKIGSSSEGDKIYTEKEMNELERMNILRALNKTRGKVSGRNGAASLLGIPSTTLHSRMIKLGMKAR